MACTANVAEGRVQMLAKPRVFHQKLETPSDWSAGLPSAFHGIKAQSRLRADAAVEREKWSRVCGSALAAGEKLLHVFAQNVRLEIDLIAHLLRVKSGDFISVRDDPDAESFVFGQ